MNKRAEKWSSFVFVSVFFLAILGVLMLQYGDDLTGSAVDVSEFPSFDSIEKAAVGVIFLIFVVFALLVVVVMRFTHSKKDMSKSLDMVNNELNSLEKNVDHIDFKLR